MDQALADLRYAATDLSELTHSAAQLPEPLLRAGLLFAPARILLSTVERMHDRNQRRYVAIQLEEGTELIDIAQQGSSAARHAQATLEVSARPTRTSGQFATPLASRFPSRGLEPSKEFGGPGLT